MCKDISNPCILRCERVHELPIIWEQIFEFRIPSKLGQPTRQGSNVTAMCKVIHDKPKGSGREGFGHGCDADDSLNDNQNKKKGK
jgi:hypothetical protein